MQIPRPYTVNHGFAWSVFVYLNCLSLTDFLMGFCPVCGLTWFLPRNDWSLWGGGKATTLDNVYNTVVCSVKILHLLTSPFTAGHYGGSYELLDDESSSSAEDEEGGQLVIDDSFNQYRKKNKKSKKSKKKKDKEKERRHSSKCMKKNTTAIAAYVYIFYSDRNTWCFLRLRCL